MEEPTYFDKLGKTKPENRLFGKLKYSSLEQEIQMQVKVVNRSTNPLPEYSSEGAACMDIRAFTDDVVEIPPGHTALIHTGLYFAIPEGWHISVRPRSGLAIKNGISVLNTPGTIDSDYRGEACVILHNFSKQLFAVHSGDRIAQIIIEQNYKMKWDPVPSLDETERGDGGFGHTGIQ